MTLRVDVASGNVVLTLPRWTSENEGLKFVLEKSGWIQRQLRNLPTGVPFQSGSVVPFLGEDHHIRAFPAPRGPAGLGPVWREDGAIHVAGEAAHHPRRVKDWFTRQARSLISPRAHGAAASLDKTVSRIVIRDTRSRWGSCSPAGVLSFSWRLVMAPEHVLDYVVCHEAAHLRELNHGRVFWALVNELHPDYETAEAWLKHFGPGLHRFG
jgi:predicted metal-dependent hydrolase